MRNPVPVFLRGPSASACSRLLESISPLPLTLAAAKYIIIFIKGLMCTECAKRKITMKSCKNVFESWDRLGGKKDSRDEKASGD